MERALNTKYESTETQEQRDLTLGGAAGCFYLRIVVCEPLWVSQLQGGKFIHYKTDFSFFT